MSDARTIERHQLKHKVRLFGRVSDQQKSRVVTSTQTSTAARGVFAHKMKTMAKYCYWKQVIEAPALTTVDAVIL